MKKFLACVTVVAFITLIGGAMIAKAADLPSSSVGFIDVQKVFLSYKETKKAQEEMAKKEKEYKKAFDERQEKLNKMKLEGKTDKDIEAATKKAEEELKPLRDAVLKLNEQMTVKLQGDIVKAVAEVAKGVGIELVFDRQGLIIGGTDLSDMVINKLNK